MLATFLNKTVSVLRLANVGGNRKTMQTVQTTECEIQNIDTRQQIISEGIASKTYRAWFEIDEDIRPGDLLRRQDTNDMFKVLGVDKQGQGLGLVAEHLEVTLVKYNM